jgi:hypothetical protein
MGRYSIREEWGKRSRREKNTVVSGRRTPLFQGKNAVQAGRKSRPNREKKP